MAEVATNRPSGLDDRPAVSRPGAPRGHVALLLARRGVPSAAIAAALGAALQDAALPPGTLLRTDRFTLVPTGPGSLLCLSPEPLDAAALGSLASLASVSEQSAAYVRFDFGSDEGLALLAQACLLDLGPQAFPVGRAAVTRIGGFGAIIWRQDSATLVALIARSMADHAQQWLLGLAGSIGAADPANSTGKTDRARTGA